MKQAPNDGVRGSPLKAEVFEVGLKSDGAHVAYATKSDQIVVSRFDDPAYAIWSAKAGSNPTVITWINSAQLAVGDSTEKFESTVQAVSSITDFGSQWESL